MTPRALQSDASPGRRSSLKTTVSSPLIGAMRHDARMGLLVNVTWGDSWRRPKEGFGRVVERIQAASVALPKPTGPDDPSIDVYIYVPGAVWQHEKEGFRLGTLSARGRSWLRVMIYVPDQLRDEDEAVRYFDTTFENVAQAVEMRLRKRRPGWPVETLVHQVRELRPSS